MWALPFVLSMAVRKSINFFNLFLLDTKNQSSYQDKNQKNDKGGKEA